MIVQTMKLHVSVASNPHSLLREIEALTKVVGLRLTHRTGSIGKQGSTPGKHAPNQENAAPRPSCQFAHDDLRLGIGAIRVRRKLITLAQRYPAKTGVGNPAPYCSFRV
jgi:hypothetical protein